MMVNIEIIIIFLNGFWEYTGYGHIGYILLMVWSSLFFLIFVDLAKSLKL